MKRTRTTTLLLALCGMVPAFAGTATIKAPAPAAAPNPLSFANGALVVDLQFRSRWEIRENNFDFNDGVSALTDDNWVLLRSRIGVKWQPLNWLSIYAQGQDSREWLSDRADNPGVLGAEGDDAFDLRQAYIELANYKEAPIGLKIGRQILSYGDERLVGAFDWNNIGRTFDAVKFTYKGQKFTADAFVSTVVVPKRGEFNQSDLFDGNETGRQQVFSGLYVASDAFSFGSVDVYGLFLNQDTNLFTAKGDRRETDFATFGTRIKGDPKKLNGFEFEFEGAYQTGDVLSRDLQAYAVHFGAGYNFFDTPMKPRVFLSYSHGSGDEDPTDERTETFQNLFPTNHKFYGYMDTFSWQNMHKPAIQVRVAPCKTVTAELTYHMYWLASTDDVWYRANGTTAVRALTPAARNADSFAGSEIDLLVRWAACKYLALEAGYSHFFAGDYLADTGASDDADFGYLQATVTF